MGTTILRGGRVIDPAAGTETVGDVLLRGDTIVAVSPTPLLEVDATVVDVTGLVVGPGFVDLHSHVHSIAGQRLQAFDGVTTNLDLEAGLMPLECAYAAAAAAGRVLNYGFSASWAAARGQVLAGVDADACVSRPPRTCSANLDWQRTSSPAELAAWLDLLERELAAGALGIGVLMGYAPRSDPAEYLAVARLAAAAGAPTFTHVRELIEADPTTPIDGSDEVAIAAAETGAAMHHCHVNSTSRRHVDRVLGPSLDAARAQGRGSPSRPIPTAPGSTSVGAFFLAPERLGAMGLTPSSIVMLGSGERIADATPAARGARAGSGRDVHRGVPRRARRGRPRAAAPGARLPRLDRRQRRDAAGVAGPPCATRRAWPLPPGASTHPRTAGTFARSLRLMVREYAAWDWLEAFRRCSYLPARVLDEVAPAMRTQGPPRAGRGRRPRRPRPGHDHRQRDSYRSGAPFAGVRHLLVGGTFVIRDGELDTDAYPGRPVRGVSQDSG